MLPKIFNLEFCYGCGVCATGCPKKIIDIRLDREGFYKPALTDSKSCINCSICDSVCSFINKDTDFPSPVDNYAIWSKDPEIREKCSSGGASLEIARILISKGYKFCGVRYNIQLRRAEHYIASSFDEALDSVGSKYIQSFTVDGLRAIDRKSKYLVVGTPCQIASLMRYIRRFKCEDNFVLMDFHCHSVPSMYLWFTYLKYVEDQCGEIKNIKWRNKDLGWHNSWRIMANDCRDDAKNVKFDDPHTYSSNFSDGDLFYRLFFGDFCSNKACSNSCIYKRNYSKADIRIGDLWGNAFKSDEKGVSGVIVFTKLGKSIIDNLTTCEVVPVTNEIVNEGQMNRNIRNANLRNVMIKYLKSEHPQAGIMKSIVFIQRAINMMKRIF